MPEHYTNEPPSEAGWYWVESTMVDWRGACRFEMTDGDWDWYKDGRQMSWPSAGYQRSIEPIPTPEELVELRATSGRISKQAKIDAAAASLKTENFSVYAMCRNCASWKQQKEDVQNATATGDCQNPKSPRHNSALIAKAWTSCGCFEKAKGDDK